MLASRRNWIVQATVTVAALTGFALAILVIVPRGIYGAGGEGGGDAHAYWVAGRNILANAPLYVAGSGERDAYLYPPPFAQIVAPFAGVLSAPAFIWAWRAFSVLCLIVAAGGWRAAGLALLVFPPAILELDTGNVSFQLAALCAMVMRGSTAALPIAFVLKLAGLAAAPFALFRDWRGFIVGSGLAAVIVSLSIFTSPSRWVEYATFLSTAQPMEYWTNLAKDVPVWFRFAVATAIGLAATRWIILLPISFVVSMPVLGLHSLAILVCMGPPIRRWLGDRIASLGPAQHAAVPASALPPG